MSETSSDFDVGPLSWVLPEIDQALTRGLDALAQFRAAPADRAPLRHAQAHVHQAAGAIQMVGLDAVVPFTDEIERGLDRLAAGGAADVDATVTAIDRACRKLKIFLAEIVAGASLQALRLFNEYAAMQSARGVKIAAASDLFFPDLAARVPERPTGPASAEHARPGRLVKQRRVFQSGLLAWLRGDAEGAATMRRAVAEIEEAGGAPGLRTFWWSVGALFDAVVGKGLEPSFGAKQLAARVDLQIRRVVEGSTKVADRLRREVLYYVAISTPVAPSIGEVQAAFRLASLLPPADVLSADSVRLEPLLRKGREEIVAAKDAWLKFASGRAENLPRLKQTMAAVRDASREIGNTALGRLTDALHARLDRMPALNMPEALAMEYATGLLLAESAFDNYFALSTDFPRQVDAMLARLEAVAAKRPIADAAGAPQLDEMSRRAQERLLLAQVVREIQVNLRRIEQVLDAFFRDHSRRAELSTLGKDSRQIGGALRMLGLDDADQLLTLCQAQIEAYANPETAVSNDELELLAEALSSLGFYVEAVEHERPDRDRLIKPILERLTGTAKEAPADAAAESVEAAVEEMRVSLPEIAAEVERAPSDAAREDLRAKLADLRDDAELIGDETLAAQAGAALQELAAGSSASLAAAVDAIAESAGATPAPEISEETQRLLATDQKKLDAEFVEIYLTEAAEVLDTIGKHRALLAQHPGAPDALRTVRRGFHTLKGSGRMVGLDELGELAYDVEKILNRLLEEERSVTPTVVAMIEAAEQSFRGWVAELSARGDVRPDPAAMHAAILAIEADLPRDRESVLARPAPRAEAPPSPPPPPVDTTPAPAPASESATVVPSEVTAAVPLSDIGLVEVGRPGAVMPEVTAIGGIDEGEAEPSAPIEGAAPLADIGASADLGDVTIGEVTLSASLYRILCDEADLHLVTLRNELSALQFDSQQAPTAEMVRASHTLHGIHRTAGFPLVAHTAKALEQALLALQAMSLPLPVGALPRLAEACAAIESLAAKVKAREPFAADDQARAREAARMLEALRAGDGGRSQTDDAELVAAREAADADEREAAAAAEREAAAVAEREAAAAAEREAAAAAEREASAAAEREAAAAAEREAAAAAEREAAAAAEREAVAAAEREAAAAAQREAAAVAAREAAAVAAREAAAASESAAAAAVQVTQPSADPLDGIRDDVDEQVLPIFLEEATELFPQAGEALRGLRRAPNDVAHARKLRRTLHTLKGSARMAGAMRLGQLTHLMESRLEDDDAQAAPGFFDLLETDLDQVAFVLDALREGRINVPLPWVAAAMGAPAAERTAGAAPAEASPVPATSPVVVPFPPRGATAPAAAAAGESGIL